MNPEDILREEIAYSHARADLKPGGRIFFLDSRYLETSTVTSQPLAGEDAGRVLRRLIDGREYRILKVFYRPEDLASRLTPLGWEGSVRTTAHYFLYRSGAAAR